MYLHLILICGLIIAILPTYLFQKKGIHDITVKEYAIAAVYCLIFMFGFMSYTGVLGSAYHLIDDHEVYTIGKDLRELGYWKTVYRCISSDLHIRFRFTYYFIRVTQCYFFRDNFVLWHVFQTVTAACGLFLSYVFARRMKCSVWGAYIFAIIIFIGGGQAAVWWRLGPQENLGIIILMSSLLSLQNYLLKNTKEYLVLSVILTILLGGIKESFLMILPLLPVWIAYEEIKRNKQDICFCNIWIALKNRWIYFLTTYFVFLVDIAIILFVVGTNKIEYAGIDASYGIVDLIKGIVWILCGRLRLYVITSIIGILCLIFPACISWVNKQRGSLLSLVHHAAIPVLLFGYFLGAQFIIHAKSGMFERYLLPTTVAFAYFWLINMNGFMIFRQGFLKGYYVFITCMAFILIIGSNDEEQARIYAKDGKNTTSILSMAASYADGNSNIIVGMGYEKDCSASVYLQEKYHIRSVYNLFYSPVEGDMVRDGYLCDADEKEMIAIEEAQMFIGYPDTITSLMGEYDISLQGFESYAFGDYMLYVLK